jgi:hypothetical protein
MSGIGGALAALVFAAGALPRLLAPCSANHDAAWFVHAAQRWLDGERLYADLLDPNLPMATYLAAVPAALARATGSDPLVLFHAGVLLAALASTVLACACVRRADLLAPRDCAWLAPVLAYLLVIAPGPDFGQREHLLAILALPWTAAVAARAHGTPLPRALAAVAGCAAGLGAGIKPWFPLAALPVLAWLLARRGARALCGAETAAAAATLALYALHVLLWPAAMWMGFAQAVQLARATYSAYDIELADLWWQPPLLECALLGVALCALPRAPGARTLACAWGAAWLGLLAVALLQRKGFTYHFLAALVCGRLLLLAAALPWLARSRAARAVLAAGLLALTAVAVLERAPRGGVRLATADAATVSYLAALRELGTAGPVLVLDTSVAPHFPALLCARLAPVARLPCLWPLPAIARDSGEATRAAEAALRDALLADWRRRPPALVVVKRAPAFRLQGDFDLRAWLLQDERFAALLQGFRLVRESDDFVFYAL